MSHSSILGGERAPQQAKGRGTDSLGPSDTSDSGSDSQGESRLKTDAEEGRMGGATPVDLSSDTDSMGTGDRAEAVPEGARDGADILPDRIASSKDALDSARSINDDDEDAIESIADDSEDGDGEDDDTPD